MKRAAEDCHADSDDSKRQKANDNASSSAVRDYLLDIEGTTTSISFVADVLFPYVRDHLCSHLTERLEGQDDETIDDIRALAKQARDDGEEAPQIDVSELVKTVAGGKGSEQSNGRARLSTEERARLVAAVQRFVLWCMDNDRKMPALKALQGHMWRAAYRSGLIKGHVYADVLPFLEAATTQQGASVWIYSSGSVEAQKLLFAHSEKGDLTKFFSGHFDTMIGSKLAAESYTTICKQMGAEPSSVLFVTDNIKEAYAADEAGLRVLVSVRPGTMALPEGHSFKAITSFEHIHDLVNEKGK
ncbi:unnamed protein product [Vitrella brassicaformis CCMP3155]|uniref:Acireductone synthase n=1 Tax=Vitrella brassicaformis (strain CCMP3155) TaxID=1169540 RepID=A0A0G4GNH2_VITBC|nr:unnamed protein product [Vitrella brassicaformis CCMP3155]|mmetsp:Transcript_48414/g.121205  ORF Transcript_48414/g.121205 Transcript_48414/m.121205 type:complete len:301 (-) Transcript_48414:1517-2419(-)|eukprot:CEM31813.1 unnamed protein product [Vitrella brassicaformis CCMP3155]